MEQKFIDRLNSNNINIHPNIEAITCIDDRLFPFSDIQIFSDHASRLSFLEYTKCLDLYNKKININNKDTFSNLDFDGLMLRYKNISTTITIKEYEHTIKLQSLAESIIKDIYDVDDGLILNAIIGNPEDFGFDSTRDDDEGDFDSISNDRVEYVKFLAKKRIILNSITHGSSMHLWKSCHYLAKEKLDEIDPHLVGLYDEYIAIVSFILWMSPTSFMQKLINEGNAINQGSNFIGDRIENESEEEEEYDDGELEEEYLEFLESKKESEAGRCGNAIGINFPVLLHELNKVVFESLSSHSIPDDLTDDEVELYYRIADSYQDEVFHYYMGPTLWNDLLEFMNTNELTIVDVFYFINKCDSDELSDFFCLLISDKNKAKLNYDEKY